MKKSFLCILLLHCSWMAFSHGRDTIPNGNVIFNHFHTLTGKEFKITGNQWRSISGLNMTIETGIFLPSGQHSGFYDDTAINELNNAIFGNPETTDQIREAVGGNFHLGGTTRSGFFGKIQLKPGLLYRIKSEILSKARWSGGVEFSFMDLDHTAHFPVMAQPGAKESGILTGFVETRISILNAGLNTIYNFPGNRLRPYWGIGTAVSMSNNNNVKANIEKVRIIVGEGNLKKYGFTGSLFFGGTVLLLNNLFLDLNTSFRQHLPVKSSLSFSGFTTSAGLKYIFK